MILIKAALLINFFIGLSFSHPSTERSVNDDLYQDSYQEIIPIPLVDYLKEMQLTNSHNLPLNNQFNIQSNQPNLNTVNLHALPSIKLDESSFVVIHQSDQNQYLDLGRVNLENREKVYVLTELKDALINNVKNIDNINVSPSSTSILIQHPSNKDLSNINLMLSFSQPSTTATPLPKLNTTTLNINSTLTSLNVVLSATNTTADVSLNSSVPVNVNSTSQLANATTFKTSSTSELVSTNIEKPKDLAKSFLLKNNTMKTTELVNSSPNTLASKSTNESGEKKPNKIQLNEELDNSTALLNNVSYSSIGDDILNINEFNRINSAGLDLILDSLNDTTADEISLNATNRVQI